MERVILTTGGTGGHIFPALAIAEEVRRRYPKAVLLFMGGQYGQEADLAVKAGLDFMGLPVRGVMGRGIKGVGAAFAMGRGVLTALGAIRKMKPQLVVGFGGYAAFAGVLAARIAGVRTAVHEQNSYPGMSNRLLGKVVDRVFLSMPDNAGFFNPDKTVLVGNPVRADINALNEKGHKRFGPGAHENGLPEQGFDGGDGSPGSSGVNNIGAREVEQESPLPSRRAPHLLVLGGSLGARAVNDGMIAAIGRLLETDMEIRHQTGQADYERVRAAYQQVKAGHVRVEPFITDMAKAYSWADLVFCRAGASTLAEVTAAGLPAVLAPFPGAAQDHQRHNARFLEKQGGAIIMEQEQFLHNYNALADILIDVLRDKARLEAMAACSFAAAKPHAARDLVDGLEALLAEKQD